MDGVGFTKAFHKIKSEDEDQRFIENICCLMSNDESNTKLQRCIIASGTSIHPNKSIIDTENGTENDLRNKGCGNKIMMNQRAQPSSTEKSIGFNIPSPECSDFPEKSRRKDQTIFEEMEITHSGIVNNIPSTDPEILEIFPCKICNQNFATKDEWEEHVRRLHRNDFLIHMLKDWLKSNRLSKSADAVNLLITRIEMGHSTPDDNADEQDSRSRKSNQIRIQELVKREIAEEFDELMSEQAEMLSMESNAPTLDQTIDKILARTMADVSDPTAKRTGGRNKGRSKQIELPKLVEDNASKANSPPILPNNKTPQCSSEFEHSNDIPAPISSSNGKPYICECGQEFKLNSRFTEHLRKHTGEKPYACTQCTETFVSTRALGRHLKHAHNMNEYTRKRAIAVAKATFPQEVLTNQEKNAFQHNASSSPRLSPSPEKHARFSKRRLIGVEGSMESEASTGCSEENFSSAASGIEILTSLTNDDNNNNNKIIRCSICGEEFYNVETYSVHQKIHSLRIQQQKGQQESVQANQMNESSEISDEIEIPNKNGGNANTVFGFNELNLSDNQMTGNGIVKTVHEVEMPNSKAAATESAHERQALNNLLQSPNNKSTNFEYSNVGQNSQLNNSTTQLNNSTKIVYNLPLIKNRATKAPVPSVLGEIAPCSLNSHRNRTTLAGTTNTEIEAMTTTATNVPLSPRRETGSLPTPCQFHLQHQNQDTSDQTTSADPSDQTNEAIQEEQSKLILRTIMLEWNCSSCNRDFGTYTLLNDHIRNEHKNNYSRNKPSYQYKCPCCRFKSSDLDVDEFKHHLELVHHLLVYDPPEETQQLTATGGSNPVDKPDSDQHFSPNCPSNNDVPAEATNPSCQTREKTKVADNHVEEEEGTARMVPYPLLNGMARGIAWHSLKQLKKCTSTPAIGSTNAEHELMESDEIINPQNVSISTKTVDEKNPHRKVAFSKEIGAPKMNKPDVKVASVSVRCKKVDREMEKFPENGKLKKTPASEVKRHLIDGEDDEFQSTSAQKSPVSKKLKLPPISDMLQRDVD